MARNPKRIERLHRVRKVREEQARAVWQAAVGKHMDAQRSLDELRLAMQESKAQLADPSGSHRPGWALVNQKLEQHLAKRIGAAKRIADQTKDLAETAEEPWRQRRTEADGLERLLDHSREATQREAERIQNREMDEVALGRSRPPGRTL